LLRQVKDQQMHHSLNVLVFNILQIKVEAVHPVVYDEYINIYYRQNTTIKLSNDYH
jgi:hypothetical protein